MTYPFVFEKPKDLSAAARRLESLQGRGAVLGGGVDLLELSRQVPASIPEVLMPLRQIAPTSYIEVRSNTLRIGAATSVAEVAESVGVRRWAWILSEAAESVGSPQIRAMTTIAGNLLQRPRCWYFRNGAPCYKNGGSDCPAVSGDNRYHAIFNGGPTYSVFHSDIGLALYALNAQLVVVSPAGERVMSIYDLYMDPKKDVTREHTLKPGEIIREIRLEPLSNRWVGTFMKARERAAFDFSLASVAVVYNNFHGLFKGMRIFLGGVAPLPYIPQKTIDAIQFKKLDRNVIPAGAALAADGAEPLSHNAYKTRIVKSLVRRALEKSYERLSWKPD